MPAKPTAEAHGSTVQNGTTDTAVYIRWSTEEQGEGTTLQTQMEACMQLCQRRGWSVADDRIYIDEGESGGFLNRPALARLRAAVAKGLVKRVIVYRLDRFSRSTPDFNKLVREEWEDGKKCRVISTTEGEVDVENPQTLLSTNIFVGFAEYERLVIRSRTYSGKQRRAAEGKNPGISTPPYGYTHGEVKGTFAVMESEAVIVQRIYREYLGGLGFSTICSGLIRDGLSTRSGGRWYVSLVKNIISSPAYMGVLEYGKSKYNPRKARKPGEKKVAYLRDASDPNYHWVENVFPVLVSKEDWEMAQSIRGVRKQTTSPRQLNSTYLLSGIVRCLKCGYPVVGCVERGRRVYRCASRREAQGICDGGGLDAEVLEKLVYELMRDQINFNVLQDVIVRGREAKGQRIELLRVAISEKQAAIAKNKKKQEKLRLAFYDSDDDSADFFKAEMQELMTELKTYVAEEKAAQAQLEAALESDVSTAWVEDLAGKIDNWQSIGDEERKSVFRLAIKSLKVFRKKHAVGKGCSRTNPHPIETELTTRLEDVGLTEGRLPLINREVMAGATANPG